VTISFVYKKKVGPMLQNNQGT